MAAFSAWKKGLSFPRSWESSTPSQLVAYYTSNKTYLQEINQISHLSECGSGACEATASCLHVSPQQEQTLHPHRDSYLASSA